MQQTSVGHLLKFFFHKCHHPTLWPRPTFFSLGVKVTLFTIVKNSLSLLHTRNGMPWIGQFIQITNNLWQMYALHLNPVSVSQSPEVTCLDPQPVCVYHRLKALISFDIKTSRNCISGMTQGLKIRYWSRIHLKANRVSRYWLVIHPCSCSKCYKIIFKLRSLKWFWNISLILLYDLIGSYFYVLFYFTVI